MGIYKNENGTAEIYTSGGGGGNSKSLKAIYDESPALYAHAVNDIIYFNEHFYKVTTAIAVGDTITVGTNISATTGIEADTTVYVKDIPDESGLDTHNAILLAKADGTGMEYGNNTAGGGSSTILVHKPTITYTPVEADGSPHGPTITWAAQSEANLCTVTNATATTAGTYTMTISLNNVALTVWDDGTTNDMTYQYTIIPGFLEGWLDTADLDPEDYPTLSDVFADEKAVRKLFTLHDSVDYLVSRASDSNIATIINNDYCAKWINLRDYALDTLYANSTIAALMDTADKYFYGEWTIVDSTTTPVTWGAKGNVPVMTSDTAPYGEVIGDSAHSSEFARYKAFDRISSTRYTSSNTSDVNLSLGYKFTNPVCVKSAKVDLCFTSSGNYTWSFKIQASNDGSTWSDVSDTTTIVNPESVTHDVRNIPISTNGNYYLYYRLYRTAASPIQRLALWELQFYGRELKVSIPTMTSSTAPYGEVFVSSYNTDMPLYYQVFGDTIPERAWATPVGTTSNAYVGYKFNRPVCISKIYFTNRTNSVGAQFPPKDIIIQGSNDNGNTWINIKTYTNNITSSGAKWNVDLSDNANSYLWYRVYILTYNDTGYADGKYICIHKLQFYGLDYSEYDWDADNPRHYIYDHGCELDTMTGGTKGDNAITLSAVGTSVTTIDTTNYTAMGGAVGMRASGTNQLKCGSATSAFSATNMPYGNGIDITSVNGSNAVGVEQTASGTFDIEAIWVQ